METDKSDGMSVLQLLEAFNDLLERAKIQGSKIVSKTTIKQLQNEIKRHIHYIK